MMSSTGQQVSTANQTMIAGMMITQQMSLQSCNTFNSPTVMPDSSSSKKNNVTNLGRQGSEFAPNMEMLQTSNQNQHQRQLVKEFNP